MGICLFWQPAIELIIVLLLFCFYLANKFCSVLFSQKSGSINRCIINMKNNRANFHSDPIWNDKALCFLKRSSQHEQDDDEEQQQ